MKSYFLKRSIPHFCERQVEMHQSLRLEHVNRILDISKIYLDKQKEAIHYTLYITDTRSRVILPPQVSK